MNARRPSGAAARFRCVVAWLLGAPRVFWVPEGSAAVCAGGRRPARESSVLRASLGASSRSPARPRRRPPAPRQVPPAPFTPVVLALRRVAWCVLLQTSSIRGVFRVAFCPVVTNVVNPGAFSLIMVVFWLGLTTFVTEVLVRRFELRWFDDVCNVGRPLVARPGPVAAHGHRSQAPQSPHRCRVQTSLAALLRPDPISHVIPLRLFQIMNLYR